MMRRWVRRMGVLEVQEVLEVLRVAVPQAVDQRVLEDRVELRFQMTSLHICVLRLIGEQILETRVHFGIYSPELIVCTLS